MRKLSQRRAMDLAIRNWHRNAPFPESVNGTAGFLWLVTLVMIFGSFAAGVIAGWEQFEHHRCHRAGTGANVELAKCLDANGAGRGGVHGANVAAPNGGGA